MDFAVCLTVEEPAYTINRKVRELVQLNQWSPHRYSLDQLVEMLDQVIAKQNK